ncbi:hypothetical protein LSTR_LSTR007017 [Laodelphax striatellus]|uniref:Uncharacterized protein n=1 Tax=Laodelphax striatellus TaxID=195883 RepID=A0A482WJC9_LAOST|nr:hypothetical protein LSTR_LSTR007017 [Laodelphax striatellus]
MDISDMDDMDISYAQEIIESPESPEVIEIIEPPKVLTVEQKMCMSLDDIIWYENELKKASSLTDVRASASEPNINRNMYVRPRSHSIGYTRPPHFQKQKQQPMAMSTPLPPTGVQCITGGVPAAHRSSIPFYRKQVQKAVRTLLANRSRGNYRHRPYNMGNRPYNMGNRLYNNGAPNNDSATYDGNGNEIDMSAITFSIKNDLAVPFRNDLAVPFRNDLAASNQNGHQSYSMIDIVSSDGTNNLELPVKANMEPDFRRFPKISFMGTRVVVSRHRIENKLNNYLQRQIKGFSGNSYRRVRKYRDMNVSVKQSTTGMSLNERFTFND